MKLKTYLCRKKIPYQSKIRGDYFKPEFDSMGKFNLACYVVACYVVACYVVVCVCSRASCLMGTRP